MSSRLPYTNLPCLSITRILITRLLRMMLKTGIDLKAKKNHLSFLKTASWPTSMPTAPILEEEEPTVESLWTCKEFKNSSNILGFHDIPRLMIPKRIQIWVFSSLRRTRVSENLLVTMNFSIFLPDKSPNATMPQLIKVLS